MKKTFYLLILMFVLLLSGCKPHIMIAQEIANSVELEVEEQYPYIESFELPKVNADVDVEYSINWTSDNPLIEIKKEDGKFICYLKNDYETQPTNVMITLEVTVGNQTAYKKFGYTVSRKITQAELDYKFDLYDNNYIIIREYIGQTNEDTLVIPSVIYYDEGDGNPSNNYKEVKIIDEYAFSPNFHENESIKKIVIPSCVEEIGKRAFAYCINLEEVIFADNSQLRTIGDEAFIDTYNLKSFTIQSEVHHIGEQAFLGSSITHFVSNEVFEWKDDVLMGKNTGSKDNYYAIYVNPFAESIRFPDEVKTISSYICTNNKYIKTVDFNQVWGVGLQAFASSSLENIINDNNIRSIDIYAVYFTPWLDNQKEDFIFIGNTLIQYKGDLEHLDIPNNVITIGRDAIHGYKLKSVFIGDNVKTISTDAFGHCPKLEWIVLEHVTPPFIGSETSFGKAKLYVKNAERYQKDYWYITNEISTKSVNVRFFDIDGNLLKETVLEYGDILDKQNAPKIEGYKFIGWIDSNGNILCEYYHLNLSNL